MDKVIFLELRIHTGIHAGARLRLTGSRYVLGSDHDCDVILRDIGVANRHAEISRAGNEWLLTTLVQEGVIANDNCYIVPGTGLAIGPVLVELADENSQWKTPQTVSATVDVNKLEDPGIFAQHADVSDGPAQTSGEVNDTDTPRNITDAAKRALLKIEGYRYINVAKIAALPTLCLLALLFVFLPPTPQLGESEKGGDRAPSVKQISQDISKLNLSYRVKVNQTPDQRFYILASLLSEDELEKLSTTLAQITPRPELTILSEDDLIEEVRNIVASRHTPLSADYLGSGHFRLNGIVDGYAGEGELIRLITTQFPMISVEEGDLMTREDLLAKLCNQLREIGAEDVAGNWDARMLILHAKVPRWTLRQWESRLANIVEPIAKFLEFKIHVEAVAAIESDLPFVILGIIGGDPPSILLSDRTKLFVGGTHQGWRLDELDKTYISFVSGPRKVVLER